MENDGPCRCCGEPGRFTQGPWPLPMSDTYCDDCYALESMAYGVWRELHPELHKFSAPVPFMRSRDDRPPDAIEKTAEEIKAFFREKLSKINTEIKLAKTTEEIKEKMK